MPHIIMGGTEKVLCEYLLLYKKYNIRVDVLSIKKVTESYFIKFFLENNIKLIDNLDTKGKYILRVVEKCILKQKIIDVCKHYDVIIDFSNLSFSRYIDTLSNYKITWIHGSSIFFSSLKKYNLSQYNKVICLTDSFKKFYIENYSVINPNIERIYNPINKDKICMEADQQSIMAKSPYFVAVQRLEEDKDVICIIEAFSNFTKIYPNYFLYIVGDGKLRDQLEYLAKSNQHIIFTGQLDNVYGIVQKAEALILSSTTSIGEGFPNVILEAQALNTLVISSDVESGPREMLLDGSAGILFEPHSSIDLFSKMRYYVENKNLCIDKINVATNALNRFSIDEKMLLDIIKF